MPTDPAINLQDIDAIVERVGRDPAHVIDLLRAVQERYHYLPEKALRRICAQTGISPATVVGVATFYSYFRHRPAGTHTIRVCIGTACHVKGAESVFDAFKQALDIPTDADTDRDKLFTVSRVACLGCCMLAPAVQIDDVTYGYVSPPKVPRVLRDFLASVARPPAAAKHRDSQTPAGAGEVRICLCSSCVAAGAAAVHAALEQTVADLKLQAELKVVGCTGISYDAPIVDVDLGPGPGHAFRYARVRPEDAPALLLRHFTVRNPLRRVRAKVGVLLEKLLTDEAWEPVTRYPANLRETADAAYVTRQIRRVTEHCGMLDPLDLDAYCASGGFRALARCQTELAPEAVLGLVEASGLRGRGGAGFPAARKWAHVRRAPGTLKYVICNGDEGDPGAFMDRMILESFPFRVLEGMAVAAYAVGAVQGYLYVRSEYPLALRRIEHALQLCEKNGLLGSNVSGTPSALKVRVIHGAGAFVCGEETALIAAIEGRRGMPRVRPPYPATCGLWNRPTLVNNVETLALVPHILTHGPEKLARLGTGTSKGTKTFALAGKIRRSGLIEVPMGITLREIIEDIGGGIPDGHRLKAVQVGGPSGGCVPAALCDTPVDYEALGAVGAMMGSGGLVVLDETDCMVDVARYFMAFTQLESCGKCTFCRVGTKRMLDILERLCIGKGRDGDIEDLEHLAQIVRRGSLCGLGRTAPNPVLSTLQHFRDEYEAHIAGHCPAAKCRALLRYTITDDCIGCTRCAQRCPAEAIAPRPYEKHEIDPEKCVRCGTCRQVCPADAVKVE